MSAHFVSFHRDGDIKVHPAVVTLEQATNAAKAWFASFGVKACAVVLENYWIVEVLGDAAEVDKWLSFHPEISVRGLEPAPTFETLDF